MATTLAAMTTDVRTLLRETTASGFTDAQIAVWLNEAQRMFVYRTGCLKAISSISTVATVRDYALPSRLIDFNSIIAVYYDQDTKLQKLGQVEFYDMASSTPYQSGAPTHYFFEDNRINIWPVPGTTDDANTTTLGAAISSTSATSATVADNTVFPYASGRVLIDTETIEFRGLSGTTGLTNLRRGAEDSTAATHSNGATVTELDLRILHVKAPTTMTASIDSQIPDPYEHVLTHYAAGMGFMKRGDQKAAQMYLGMWESEIQKSVQQLDENAGPKDRYHQILPIEAVSRTKFGRI